MRELASPALSGLTTLRLGGTAIALLEPENESDLLRLDERAASLGGELFFLGRGSNLLARDGELPVVLASLSAWQKIRIAGARDGTVLVEAGAGAPLPRLLRFCAANGLSGLEGLTGIPGSVGGACAMNAGSFGCETGARISALRMLTENGLKWLGRDELNFGYRFLKINESGKLPLIIKAVFALTQAGKSVIFSRMNLNFLEKKSRQPVTSWSAGCAFKNPASGPSAGKLLEQAGFRGKKAGGMAFASRHANFLVNEGHGTAAAAFDLLAQARAAVARQSGIELESEIRILQ
ncbi:MAG: UDP-N-acetylmuramate dehydrogenase [Desulfovibrio sp.]|nr:UDP-N-acetylmuramate dehydrogenase [Desulfovibrio sp.]